MLIPKTLDPEEECVRCVLHPLMYSQSKGRLNRTAFLPPPGGNKVSLLRLAYTTGGYDFCIKHGRSLIIKDNTFVGLASISPKMVKECSDSVLKSHSLGAEILYAPMHQGQYIDSDVDIDTTNSDIDLPMHADLVYVKIAQGEVQTTIRKFAHELSKKARFFLVEEQDIIPALTI